MGSASPCITDLHRASNLGIPAPDRSKVEALAGQPHPAREAPWTRCARVGRSGFAPVMEWLLAAGLLPLSHRASLRCVVRELRAAPAAALERTGRPHAVGAASPAAVPPRAVSVPVLPFHDGKEVRVGDSVAAVATRSDERPRSAGRRSIAGPRRAADALLRVRAAPASSWSSSRSSGTAKSGLRRSICREYAVQRSVRSRRPASRASQLAVAGDRVAIPSVARDL